MGANWEASDAAVPENLCPILMSNELPEELVTQILLCLPVVSLLRFKSVCKSWYALITHQYFITKHLLHIKNKNSNTYLVLTMRDKTTGDFFLSTLSYEPLQVSLRQPIPPQIFDKESEIFVGGSCNGLVCLLDQCALHVVIWNPATKETKVVPKSNLPRFAPAAGFVSRIQGLGFGFDAKTNDYKIVQFFTKKDPNYHDEYETDDEDVFYSNILQTEVYSLSADSWRKVDGPPCFPPFLFWTPNAYINGMASWIVPVDRGEKFVLSFDMSDEVFLKTPLPYDFSEYNLFVLNESIAMATPIRNMELRTIKCIDIWLLLEVGVQSSWTKHFTIGPDTKIDRLFPVGLWKEDTMFFEDPHGQLILYDHFTKEIKEISNLQMGERCLLKLFTYIETLVSV